MMDQAQIDAMMDMFADWIKDRPAGGPCLALRLCRTLLHRKVYEMPSDYGQSVVHRHGSDYWRTWFLFECQREGTFGLTKGHLPLVCRSGIDVIPYHIGTRLYLEDAPYFPGTQKKCHRVAGPYEVAAAGDLGADVEVVHWDRGIPIVWYDSHPERGPWLNRSRVTRTIDGVPVTFRQMASSFGYFPYRFRIKRAPKYRIEIYEHHLGCWLCA